MYEKNREKNDNTILVTTIEEGKQKQTSKQKNL